MAEKDKRQKLNSLTVDELRQRARGAGYIGISRLRKGELIDLLLQLPAGEGQPTAQPATEPEAARARSALIPGLIKVIGMLGIVLSIIISLALPVGVWWAGDRLARGLTSMANTAEEIESGLALAAGNLESGAAALDSASQALRTANQSLAAMDPLLDSFGELLGEELPVTIEATSEALISAQDGAAAMDRVLRSLRFFGLNYNPEMPLDQSLEQTAISLEGLPQSLRDTQSDLNRSQQDLGLMAKDLDQLASDLDEFSADLRDSTEELFDASQSIGESAESLRNWGSRLPRLRWPLALVSLLAGGWLLVLHLSMWRVGRMASAG